MWKIRIRFLNMLSSINNDYYYILVDEYLWGSTKPLVPKCKPLEHTFKPILCST